MSIWSVKKGPTCQRSGFQQPRFERFNIRCHYCGTIVNLLLRKPEAFTTSKKRKLQGGEERLVSKVGTRAHHF